MAADKNRTSGKKEPKELYLKVPYHILNIPGLGLCEKVLLAHIYSFGEKGCRQSNATLGQMFFVDGRTISRWLARLKKNALVLWVHPAERKSQAVRNIEEFKKRFGLGKGRRQTLTEEEFDRRKQKQKLALQASG